VKGDPELLSEVSETAVRGPVASTYVDIRRVLGVPTVMLVYRVLAVQPGRLERVWDAVAPNLAAAATQHDARMLEAPEIGSVEPMPPETIAMAGVDPHLLAATLDCFDRSNRLNLIGLTTLLTGSPGNADVDPRPASPTEPREMLPMTDLESIPRTRVALLREMSAPIAGPEEPLVIPSLFRYLAHDERLLQATWHSIAPAIMDDRFQDAVTTISGHAQELGAQMPHPVPQLDDRSAVRIVTRFVTTIPGMIVTTRLLRLALRVAPVDRSADPNRLAPNAERL
jgi:hypothetical protein